MVHEITGVYSLVNTFEHEYLQIADQLMSMFHQKCQLRGYLEFNRKIIPCMRASLITVTSCNDVKNFKNYLNVLHCCFPILGSILMLMIAAIAWDFCPHEGTCSVAAPLTPAHYVQIVLSLQTCILLPVCLSYSCKFFLLEFSEFQGSLAVVGF